jgi:hypothetical protein
MTLAGTESKSTYGHGFERKAFQCAKCDHIQTYTMGTAIRRVPGRRVRTSLDRNPPA